MKKFLIIGYCLFIIGCSNQDNQTNSVQSIHPAIKGIVKQQGQAVANAQVSLTSSNCDELTAITDKNGQFSLEQYCQVPTASIAVMGTVAAMSYAFDMTVTINEKSYLWSVIDPYDIQVEFDLSEQMVCKTAAQENHCAHLVLLEPPAEIKH